MFVAAGAALARVVQPSPVWLELALQPDQAARLGETPVGLFVRRWAEDEPAWIAGADLRLVSRAPEVDPDTGYVRPPREIYTYVPDHATEVAEGRFTDAP